MEAGVTGAAGGSSNRKAGFLFSLSLFYFAATVSVCVSRERVVSGRLGYTSAGEAAAGGERERS